MSTQDFVRLELPPQDFDGDGTDETAVFEFHKEYDIQPGIRRGFLVGETGQSTVNSVISNYIDETKNKYQTFHVGLGVGQHVYQLDFTATARDDARWGTTGNSGTATVADATGGTRVEKLAVLDRCLAIASTDSFAPARLEWGGYAPGALFDDAAIGNQDGLDVIIQDVNLPKSTDEASTFQGSLTFVTTVPADEILDAGRRTLRDL